MYMGSLLSGQNVKNAIFHCCSHDFVPVYIRDFPRNNKVWAHGPMSLKFDGPFLQ